MKKRSAPKGAPQDPAAKLKSKAQITTAKVLSRTLTEEIRAARKELSSAAVELHELRLELERYAGRPFVTRRQAPAELIVALANEGDSPAIVDTVAFLLGGAA